MGGLSRTDNKANISPEELDCCWNWAELAYNSTLHLSVEELEKSISVVIGIFQVTSVE